MGIPIVQLHLVHQRAILQRVPRELFEPPNGEALEETSPVVDAHERAKNVLADPDIPYFALIDQFFELLPGRIHVI